MSTITTINASDAVKDSRAVINTNFSNLNTDKAEKSANLSDMANANTALNNILPSQATFGGKVLGTDGSSTSWVDPSGANKATDSVIGLTKLSCAAADPSIPIAVGDNDTRMPTADEKAALDGTGTPSGSNKFVTADTIAGFESTSNKSTTTTLGTSDTYYPTQNAVKTYVDNLTSEAKLMAQPFCTPGDTGVNALSCLPTGFSTTEPIFFVSKNASTNGRIYRFIKQSNGSIALTHISGNILGSANNECGMCVVGNYVYVAANNSNKVIRYDKADLANPTEMTVSGTGVTGTTQLFSDGTYLYNVYTTSAVRKYSISGTTLTYDSVATYDNIIATDITWCDGTYIYQGGYYRWTLGSSARATVVSIVDQAQFLIAGGTFYKAGVIKEAANTTYAYCIGVNTASLGRVIPTTSF